MINKSNAVHFIDTVFEEQGLEERDKYGLLIIILCPLLHISQL